MSWYSATSSFWKVFPERLVYAVLVAGGLLRVVVWLQNRSVFLDEANLARNFYERQIGEFFQPLNYEQYAPPLFSIIQKISVICLPRQELAFRLFPLLCSLLAIWIFYQIARRLIGNNWVLLATVYIFCFSELLLRYATEGKQYSSDLLVALGLIWFGLSQVNRPFNAIRAMLLGVVAVWLSMPSVFVLAGLGLYLLQTRWNSPERRQLLIVFAGWLLSFAAYYWVLLRPSLAVQPLVSYHQPWFFPLFPNSAADLHQAADLLSEFPYYTAGYTVLAKLVGTAGILTGLFFIFGKKRTVASLLAVPVLACIFASGLEKYSLIPRMLVWAFPLVMLIQGMGWDRWWSGAKKWYWQGIILVAFAAVVGLHRGWQYFGKPYQIEEIRLVLEAVQQDFQPGDVLYAGHEAWPALEYYRRFYINRDLFEFNGNVIHGDWEGVKSKEQLVGGREAQRVWVVYSHVVSEQARNSIEADLATIRTFATQKKVVEFTGARGYLFQME